MYLKYQQICCRGQNFDWRTIAHLVEIIEDLTFSITLQACTYQTLPIPAVAILKCTVIIGHIKAKFHCRDAWFC